MRGRTNGVKSHVLPVQIGWQLHGVARGMDVGKIDARKAPQSCCPGVPGIPGSTTWFGLIEIGQPIVGETLVVSAASGTVGSAVGRLAKIKGRRMVGVAGRRTKRARVNPRLWCRGSARSTRRRPSYTCGQGDNAKSFDADWRAR